MKENNVSSWMFFLGVLLLLMGVYGVLRILHVQFRNVPYPYYGVFPTTFLTPGKTNMHARESACAQVPNKMMLRLDALKNEQESNLNYTENYTENCIEGFNEDRAKQEQRDKNQAGFLIFVGAGLVFARKFLQ